MPGAPAEKGGVYTITLSPLSSHGSKEDQREGSSVAEEAEGAVRSLRFDEPLKNAQAHTLLSKAYYFKGRGSGGGKGGAADDTDDTRQRLHFRLPGVKVAARTKSGEVSHGAYRVTLLASDAQVDQFVDLDDAMKDHVDEIDAAYLHRNLDADLVEENYHPVAVVHRQHGRCLSLAIADFGGGSGRSSSGKPSSAMGRRIDELLENAARRSEQARASGAELEDPSSLRFPTCDVVLRFVGLQFRKRSYAPLWSLVDIQAQEEKEKEQERAVEAAEAAAAAAAAEAEARAEAEAEARRRKQQEEAEAEAEAAKATAEAEEKEQQRRREEEEEEEEKRKKKGQRQQQQQQRQQQQKPSASSSDRSRDAAKRAGGGYAFLSDGEEEEEEEERQLAYEAATGGEPVFSSSSEEEDDEEQEETASSDEDDGPAMPTWEEYEEMRRDSLTRLGTTRETLEKQRERLRARTKAVDGAMRVVRGANNQDLGALERAARVLEVDDDRSRSV